MSRDDRVFMAALVVAAVLVLWAMFGGLLLDALGGGR